MDNKYAIGGEDEMEKAGGGEKRLATLRRNLYNVRLNQGDVTCRDETCKEKEKKQRENIHESQDDVVIRNSRGSPGGTPSSGTRRRWWKKKKRKERQILYLRPQNEHL